MPGVSKPLQIAILGAGAWGTALALHFTAQHTVRLWARQAQLIDRLRSTRENKQYLPGFGLPARLMLTADLSQALAGAEVVLVVVPTAGFRGVLQAVKSSGQSAPVIWACKGFEPGSALMLHQVAEQVLGSGCACGVISGPSFAQEVARGLPCALTLAASDAAFAQSMAAHLNTGHMRVYSSTDVVGVELGGAVKNVMAIAAGISDGMGFGLNARAALMTRGLAEITRLGLAMGGQQETFMGLTGAGDLILTCTGDLSRNRTVGLQLAQGKSLPAILEALGHTAEGVHTCAEVQRRAHALGVEMPITNAVYRIMFEQVSPGRALEELLAREPKAEYCH